MHGEAIFQIKDSRSFLCLTKYLPTNLKLEKSEVSDHDVLIDRIVQIITAGAKALPIMISVALQERKQYQ